MLTGPWICDTCGQLIEKPEDGYVEWLLTFSPDKAFGLKLVHHVTASPIKTRYGCGYDETKNYNSENTHVVHLSLPTMLGNDGLMQLLLRLQENLLPKEEVIEMIKRLHIPNYEQARPNIDSAVSQGEIDRSLFHNIYGQEQLKRVIRWKKEEDSL